MAKDNKVRVRFAPSPTGPLHIGGARTALFNWLFAKSQQGDFILRIEDTDKERSKPEFEEDIKKGLEWLGITWDEYYRQSDRGEIYREYLEKLLEEHKAYYCFCSKEELEAQKEAMRSQGLAPKYSGKCRVISVEEAKERMEAGESAVIRLKIPDTQLSFTDLIRGKITFDGSLMGDMVIARDLDSPLYNFVVIIDDALNEITHVIRGEDHISNTPKQIVLIDALDFDRPEFAHLPIILNPDRSKMSKRFADTSLTSYMEKGYVKEAMVNFLGLLGWHPENDREVLSIEDLLSEFSLERVQKGGAAFDQDKLDWLGAHYLKEMDAEKFITLAKGFVPDEWEINAAMVESVRGRVSRLEELEDLLKLYFDMPEYKAEILAWKDMTIEEAEANLESGRKLVDAIDAKDFEISKLEEILLEAIPRESRGEILWPLRVALSGAEKSPSPFEIMAAVGKEESLNRIDSAIAKVS